MKEQKEQILELRAQGKTYREIEQLLGCSRSNISYHCGKGQKEKYLKRQQILRRENTLLQKVDTFTRPSCDKRKRRKLDEEITSSFNQQVRDKVRDFGKKKPAFFTYKDVVEKFGEKPNCYLSGRTLDLSSPRTYNFDHIIPASKGGTSLIGNLGLTTREANMAKGDMSVQELLELCVDILCYNGYKVEKP